MKLKVIVGRTPIGRKVAYLADENEEMLPGQVDTKLECSRFDAARFTVTFLIQGSVELVEWHSLGSNGS